MLSLGTIGCPQTPEPDPRRGRPHDVAVIVTVIVTVADVIT